MAAKTLNDLKAHLTASALQVSGISSAAWLFNYEEVPGATYPRIEIMRDIPNSNIDSHSVTRGGAWDTFNLIISVSDTRGTVLSAADTEEDMETTLRRYLYAFLYKAFSTTTMRDITLVSAVEIPVNYLPKNKATQRAEITARLKVRVFVGSAETFA